MRFELTKLTTAPSMWGESPSSKRSLRRLTREEFALMDSLLSRSAATDHLRAELPDAQVEEMCDGHMGSLRFNQQTRRSMGREIVRAEYIDEDGIPVSVSVNTDVEGKLFELDLWKVDFSPLRRFPEPLQVRRV